jgi:hypothetical protein
VAGSRLESVARIRHLALILALVLAGPAAHAQVDCDTPDDLCVGDPCVIGSIEVDDSCVLDFGTRALVIAGTLKIPNSGELSLTAGAIEVSGRIQNLAGSVPGAGPRITLAAAGDVLVDAPIRLAGVRGALQPGELTIQAGGDLAVHSALTALTSPTTISWTAAAGDVLFTGRVNTSKPGGEIDIVAGGGIDSLGTFRRLERIDMSVAGNALIGGRVSAKSSLTVDAGGLLDLVTVLRDSGSDVTLRGALGVTLQKSISITPLLIDDGSATLESSGGDVVVSMPLRANDVAITAAGDVTLDALVAASPPARAGGMIDVESTGGTITANAAITAQPGDGGATGDGAGGHVRLVAAGAVDVRDNVFVNAFPQKQDAPGGTVEIEGASVVAGPGVTFDADGHPPGPDFPGAPPAGFRVTATAGSVTLGGEFHARGGPSVIQVTATGDVTVAGDYRALPDGCIGLDAGGTLTTGGATFDTPPVGVCP